MGTNTHDIIIGELRYRITENKAIVTGYYKPLKGELVIPETVEGVPVTEIADEALEHLQVTKLTAKSIRRAGRAGLRYCRNMEQIDMPQLEYIGDEAFGCMHPMAELYLPSVVETGKGAFKQSNFTKVSMPKLKHISEFAFFHSIFMKEADFPGVERIDEFAFCRCGRMERINVKNATYIAPHAFMGCRALRSIEADCEYDNSNLTASESEVHAEIERFRGL